MKKIVLTTLLLCSGNVLALDYFVQGGLHFGGDKLAQAQFTNGKSDSIKAGELISLSAGIGSEIIDGVEARVLAGAKFDTINAKNGDVIFLRYPIEALVLYQAGEKIY
ncbi:MAG TPA: hypothetical protein ENJ87_02740, partial [Gammaproteobacteria bacterium]|nr:hypothetical protein [Gammaproteobacteria bacterium]